MSNRTVSWSEDVQDPKTSEPKAANSKVIGYNQPNNEDVDLMETVNEEESVEEIQTTNDNQTACTEPTQSERRRVLLILVVCTSIFCTICILAGLVGYYVYRGNDDDNSTGDESNLVSTSTTGQSSEKIMEHLKSISFDNGTAIEQDGSSQNLAIQWILEEGGTNWTTTKLTQRFVLATIWFATKGNGWTDIQSWKTAEDECGWDHPETYIPTTFGNLDLQIQPCNTNLELQSLSFRGNNLSGPLPNEVGLLTNLK